jgi:hypothetical protein
VKKVILFLALTLAVAAALVPLATGAPAATQTVRVNATSYKIALSAKPKAGTVRFVVRNVGDDEHDVWIRGGGRSAHTPVLAPGRSATITMKLKRGVVYRSLAG